jgi:hypothetical protein
MFIMWLLNYILRKFFNIVNILEGKSAGTKSDVLSQFLGSDRKFLLEVKFEYDTNKLFELQK